MSKPTQEQVQAEITALKEIKQKVRKFSAFGDNNHAKIEAQIRVLERRMSEDEIYDHWDGDDDYETLSCARDARAWLDGEKLESGDSLVDDWKPLAS